jgi:hypothetical protein
MLDPGTDGLIDTTADAAANPSTVILPGKDGILGTADDVVIQLSDAYNMTRTITISSIANETSVRQIQVTINYTYSGFTRSYTLTTMISQYS